jgi:hypothetical protein
MFGTLSRGLAVVAIAVSAIAGLGIGSAQAQSMPFQAQVIDFHVNAGSAAKAGEHAVKPNTRDMSVPSTKVTPQSDCDGWYYINGWGVNLRSSPWGEIRGHANYGDSIYYLETQGDWSMINDYTANAWGVWIYNAYLGYDTPTCIQ